MEKYVLKSNEVLLYENQVKVKNINDKANVILTNLYFAIEVTQKVGRREYETTIEQYPLESIKYYNDKPQIIQKKEYVILYFVDKEVELEFDSFFAASKFVNKAQEAATGKNFAIRGADSMKKALGVVDDTLGINVTGTIASVVENGVARTLVKGVGNKKASKSKLSNAAGIISAISSNAVQPSKSENSNTAKTIEQRVEEVKKLKELLDMDVISQADFDAKKKDILGF